jgi:hypothetical protein
LVVRSLIGAATLAIVAAALLGYLWWQGLPRWLPDRLESALSAWLPFV